MLKENLTLRSAIDQPNLRLAKRCLQKYRDRVENGLRWTQ